MKILSINLDKINCVKQEGNKKIFERYMFEVHIFTKKITMDQEDLKGNSVQG